MAVIEKLNLISNTMDELMNFVQNDESVKEDFNEYLTTIGMKNPTETQLQVQSIPYIFERLIELKTIPEIFLEKSKNLAKPIIAVAKALFTAQSSIFEIKKVLKNGFEMYNLINEKTYNVISLTKMTHLRGIGAGQFVVARIFEFEKEYYLLEISGVLASNQKDQAMRYAIARIIQTPEIVYKDNPQMEKRIEKQVENLHKKFLECFSTTEVITTNKLADDLMGLFNDYADGKNVDKETILSKIQEPEIYKFFEVKEFNNAYENFLENSMGGFSSHKGLYDVGIVYDEELGLFAVPFYKTFCKIFEENDYKNIENYDKCIEHFLLTDGISANILKLVNSKYDNFMKVVNEVNSTNMTFEELLEKYKPQYLKEKIYSSTTVLYESNIFTKTIGYLEDETNKPQLDVDVSKIGRNDPCPCGSGKKFKKCCGIA